MASKLFSPITLRQTEIRNRLWVSPMCQYSATARDGMPTDWHLGHYAGMARGGAGLVIVEATGVVPEGRISPECLGLWNDAQRDALGRVVELVHAAGAKIAVQLGHAGRKASTYAWLPGAVEGTVPESEGGWATVAPSARAFGDLAEPREMTQTDIDAAVTAFVSASTRAVEAGFDAVEIHGAHGYLGHQFLSPLSNLRTDEYGGDLWGRSRFLREVVAGVRDAHPVLPVLVRLSATDWVEGGLTAEDVTQVAGWLQDAGADLIDVSSGGNVERAQIPVGAGYQAPLAAKVKDSGAPVAAVGMITSAQQAETLLRLGSVDAVCVAREWLRNPYLGLHWAKELRGDLDAIRPAQLWRAF
ncbi:NADH:flavin oxidoreductase/NADH oxidase [Gulosibacter molinativorax]|uniref:NADH:flavin oxidoreductase/NADH oxidase n=1 Tax=Gulosibacter molinativorax TaxID=256821 RepID=A0ABT7C7E5_9MICO|nr:NADH:flavin oxidoreductase/NADH oxidase [Gulosibacter molinativorax]MDJ1371125.1 NADH:flavin oxidoreductase/NADH oxidase [Gulosibacter molinativorax]QUY61485.1 NADPH dehydrogenase [Gulosibacter molinativorax]